MERAKIFNVLALLEVNYNYSWRAYRKCFGRKDATHRYFEVKA